jgi:hypothetical protein
MRQHTKSAASLLAATVACGLFSQTASAQFSSTTRTGSTSGNALTSGTTAATGATSGFGGATAGGGAANAAIGGNNAANRTAGTGQAALGQSLFNQGNNQNAFIGGRNQTQGQGFIGANQRTGQQQNNRQQQQNNRQSNFGQNDFNNSNSQGPQQNQDQRRAIRPTFKVAFEALPKPTTEVRSTLQPRFDSLSQTPSLRGVVYELNADGVVILRGTVDTPSQMRLAENVVKLEPGVKKVRNELTLNDK